MFVDRVWEKYGWKIPEAEGRKRKKGSNYG
jgi:hypothetical protein